MCNLPTWLVACAIHDARLSFGSATQVPVPRHSDAPLPPLHRTTSRKSSSGWPDEAAAGSAADAQNPGQQVRNFITTRRRCDVSGATCGHRTQFHLSGMDSDYALTSRLIPCTRPDQTMTLVQVWDVPHLQRPHGAPRYGGHSSAQATTAAPAPEPSIAQPPMIKRGTRGILRHPQVTPVSNCQKAAFVRRSWCAALSLQGQAVRCRL